MIIKALCETPARSVARMGIRTTIIGALFVCLFRALCDVPHVLHSILLLAFLGHGGLVFYCFRGNLGISIRYFLLWLPGVITAVAWTFWPGVYYTAPFGVGYQTSSSTTILLLGSFLSCCGATIGWLLSGIWKEKKAPIIGPIWPQSFGRNIVYVIFCIFCGLLYVSTTGGFIGGGKLYADGATSKLPFVFNSFGVLHTTGASLVLLELYRFRDKSVWQPNIKSLILFFGIIVSFGLGMAAGSRADYLFPAVLIILLFIFNLQGRRKSNRVVLKRFWAIRRILPSILIGILSVFVATTVAKWRFAENASIIEIFTKTLYSGASIFIKHGRYADLIWIETGNHMIGGFYGIIAQIDKNQRGFGFGRTYGEYLLRLPPSFLGLPRPQGLEWETDVNGKVMSQGGIWEPAEAYYNFGLVGCFFVSMIISLFYRYTLNKYMRSGSRFWWAWYCCMTLMALRCIWYQNFAYIRIASIFLLYLPIRSILRGHVKIR